MFKRTIKSLHGYKVYKLSANHGLTSFSTIPELGCCLFDLQLKNKNLAQKVFKNWPDKEDFHANYYNRFPSAQLFPFPNRLEHGCYKVDGQEYAFDINDFGRPNALHGNIYHQPFQPIENEIATNKMAFVYYGNPSNSAYPFKYEIINTFELQESSFKASTEIKNLSSKKIPVGYGWHPYFSCPNKIDSVRLKLPKAEILEVNEQLIPTGDFKGFNNFEESQKIGNMQLDSCFKKLDSKPVELCFDDEDYLLQINSPSFQYVQIYLPTERNCIAIEPQSCGPNAFNNKLGLIELEPDEIRNFHFEIRLIPKNRVS